MHSLSEIWIYPIKSLGGIPLTNSHIESKGLTYDRNYMLVDHHGKFISQRQFPLLNQLDTFLEKDGFAVQQRNSKNQIHIPFELNGESTIPVQIWEDTCQAIVANDAINQWFTDFLKTPCRLVFLPSDSDRHVDPDYAPPNVNTSLTDGFPFLIIGQASLDYLNEKLASNIKMDRFRPNFVFTGGVAHEEDTWNEFRIGKANFKRVKPCARCIVTTIDPVSSKPGKEPLKTLSTYRKKGGKIHFGQNLICTKKANLTVGDDLQIIN